MASHKLYKQPIMLVREDGKRFMTVSQNDKGMNVLDQVFRIELMKSM